MLATLARVRDGLARGARRQFSKGVARLSDHYTDFVADDPWLRPQPARIEQACEFLRGELASSRVIKVRDDEIVSVFFSPGGSFRTHCPHCGAELPGEELAAWLDQDYAKLMEINYGGTEIHCPACGVKTTFHVISKRRAFACQECGHHIYPCADTIFHKSRTKLTGIMQRFDTRSAQGADFA
jgi:DNA-directed RNA polymerase subunit RPC12/RpoP